MLFFINQELALDSTLSLSYAPMKISHLKIERSEAEKMQGIRDDNFLEKNYILIGGNDCRVHLYRLKLAC